MLEKTLKPIYDKIRYSQSIMDQIDFELYYTIYKPLLDILEGKDIRESAKASAVINALNQGKLNYKDGFMFGSFNAAISKELVNYGAKFNKQKKAYKIELTQLPQDLRAAIAHAGVREANKLQNIQRKLQEIKPELIPTLDFKDQTDGILLDLNTQFHKVTPKDLEVPLELNDFQRQKITQDYTENLNLGIKDWATDAVLKLRFEVEEHVSQGLRAESLKDIILSQYGESKNRAKFLARQETSLLVSKYRQVRYEDAGINKYRWSTSNDERVRASHRALNGRIFSFDDPPITDLHTGAKNNPGEDFGCRCVALPVFQVAGKLV